MVARVVWDHDVAGSNPVIPTNKKRQVSTETCRFLNDVFHFVEHDVHFVRDVRLRRVMCLRAWVEHITSLCGIVAKHHCECNEQHHCAVRHNITILPLFVFYIDVNIAV